jgi:TPR repeat protein
VKQLLTALLVVGSMGMTGPVFAQDFEKGARAQGAKDYATAMKEWRFLAERGHAGAQFELAKMYDYGLGALQDYNEAVYWYLKAAEQGDVGAQYNLGFMYADGHGVLRDNSFAHMWFNIAASKGFDRAATKRDETAKKMSAADISKAQELARECVKKQYKGC